MLSYGDDRGYAANAGYADQLESVYRYDNFVQNSRQISEGDLLIICGREWVLGVASVARLVSAPGTKQRRWCPECRAPVAAERKELRPRFRCKENHTFDEPNVTYESCIDFAAWFDGTFRAVAPDVLIPIGQVRAACLQFNKQMAMQEVKLSRLKDEAAELLPLIHAVASVGPGDAVDLIAADALPAEAGYAPSFSDERERVQREIRARRGQSAFREQLRARFNDTCVVTGCGLVDLLEAAHILPYRGVNDHHLSNGLLLRADIHTLFDLDFLGIEPGTLKVHLHRRAQGMGYDAWDGQPLTCDVKLLSPTALQARWMKFQARR
ncbi:HNH endonuclease [Myxococcus fulvus]|uniref:HNH endonuclease n=1 Tax=Myxococcus fulvus TaxID=33 RepID=UPI003B9D54ED